MQPENWICNHCKNVNPADAPRCICGQAPPPPIAVSDLSRSGRRFPLWLGFLPLIAPLFLAVHAGLQFSRAAQAINPDSGSASDRPGGPSCVDTYGITLNASEFYVREGTQFTPNKNQTPEVSTVLRGMARNGCGENLKRVRIRFVVHDDDGRKGTGVYVIEQMENGEAKPFEHAWMGRITSYEVTADR